MLSPSVLFLMFLKHHDPLHTLMEYIAEVYSFDRRAFIPLKLWLFRRLRLVIWFLSMTTT